MTKNVVFDIGNVLLQWAPEKVVRTLFPEEKDPQTLTVKIFKSPLWYDLNMGKLTENEAIKDYSRELSIPEKKIEELLQETKRSLLPIPGSLELLDELYGLGIPIYSITDNIREIISYLKTHYDFFDKFTGMVVSADIGVLKPSPLIYKHLIDKYGLIPQDCVFIDDLLMNVKGAQDVGFQGIQFITAEQCRDELINLGFLTR